MPLSPPAPREQIHDRRITCAGFRRQDGLLDIEGHIIDIRPFPYYDHWDGSVVDCAPVHEMWLRLTIDQEKRIADVEAAMDHTPFPNCPGVANHYKRLIGLVISPGFGKRMHDRVGNIQGCTHVTGLIQIMATTLLQALTSEAQRILPPKDGESDEALRGKRLQLMRSAFANPEAPRYPLLNTCYSHAAFSPVVERLAPEYHRPEKLESESR